MSEKEKLVLRLRTLYTIHKLKQRAWQKENNLSVECGCITRESCQIASLMPEMLRLGITPDDYTNGTD